MAVPGNNHKESCCVRAVKWIPVLFILTIVFWSYYAYVVQLCILTVESTVKQVLFLITYHFLYGMFLWSYWQTVFTASGKVPDKFKLSDGEYERLLHADNEEIQRQMLEDFSRNLPNLNRTVSGSVRYCEKCRLVKPDRTHHCSVCGKCILKMDHHCPWVNNCIGFTNYKFFVLFLGYALIYCVYVALTSLQYFVKFWHGALEGAGRFHILFLFFVALMFAISLVSLFCYHCYLVLQNRTTLEAFRAPIFQGGPDKQGFDLGKYNNFREIFGVLPKLWLIPVVTSLGNGYTFPRRKSGDDTEQLLAGAVPGWEEENHHIDHMT